MTRPDHLFVSSDGALYDTRNPDWSRLPALRNNFRASRRTITTTSDLRATLRAGAYTDVGGYPLYFVTADGGALSYETVRENIRLCMLSIIDDWRDEWRVIGIEVNYEDGDLRDEHTGKRIPSAYADDEEVDLSRATLFSDGNRGVYIPQHFAESVERQYVTGVSDEDYATLAKGPDAEFYWDVWTHVLDNARIADPKMGESTLHQDGDLWVVPCAAE